MNIVVSEERTLQLGMVTVQLVDDSVQTEDVRKNSDCREMGVVGPHL